MKNLKSIILKGIMSISLLTFTIVIYAQSIAVSGTVTDENKEPLVGVTVQLMGTGIGTVTDIDGNFKLPTIPTDGNLEVSYVGMHSQIIKVDGRSTINIVLKQDTELLDELVVVGYGVQKKVNVTGAVDVI